MNRDVKSNLTVNDGSQPMKYGEEFKEKHWVILVRFYSRRMLF